MRYLIQDTLTELFYCPHLKTDIKKSNWVSRNNAKKYNTYGGLKRVFAAILRCGYIDINLVKKFTLDNLIVIDTQENNKRILVDDIRNYRPKRRSYPKNKMSVRSSNTQ